MDRPEAELWTLGLPRATLAGLGGTEWTTHHRPDRPARLAGQVSPCWPRPY